MVDVVKVTVGELTLAGVAVNAVTVLERNAAGDISRCSCLTADIPSAVAGYAIGCILIATNGNSAATVIKVNTATAASCTFTALA